MLGVPKILRFYIVMIEDGSIDLLLMIFIFKLNLYDLINLLINNKNEFYSDKLKIINKKGEDYL